MLSTKSKEAIGPIFHYLNALRLQWLKWTLSGDGVYCACCNSNFKKFASFGTPRRQNAWCPSCESLERHRLLWIFLNNKTNLYKQWIKLLHIAPETIFFKHFSRQPNIEYHPADKFNNMYPAGTAYIDLLNIDTPSNHYDAIICNHVFQYIPEDRKAMKEIYRVLKPGGWAILQVPINKNRSTTLEDDTLLSAQEREKAFGLKDHVRYYSLDYPDRLREAGFTVHAIDFSAQFSNAEIKRYGFWKGDEIFYCIKNEE